MDIALSAREREVAELVADGLTNRQIAERLVISERTAEGHVEQIRNKLGFHSRTQIAGWVERQRATPTPVPSASARSAAIALEVPRPIRVEVPRVPRAAIAVILAMLLVALGAVTFWPRTQPTPLVLVAGIGTRGYSGDSGPATAAQIDEPTSIAFDRDGALVFGDSYLETAATGIPSGSVGNRTRVRRIDAQGIIRTIVGELSPPRAFNIVEVGRQLFMPLGSRVAIGPDNMLYVAAGGDGVQNWVGRIDDAGRFTWLAGGAPCCTVPNRRTPLSLPLGLAVAADGVVYVANTGTSQVLAIPPQGSVVTIAGTGQRGASGDGGPATAATFYAPASIRLAPDESLYVVDTYNQRVRAIDHGGTVSTFAGTGARGFGGDGGPATRSQLSLPTDIAFGPDGVVYIADSANARVRAVAKDGTITTVAGPAGLVRPNTLALDAKGALYIGDGGAHRIFKLARPSR